MKNFEYLKYTYLHRKAFLLTINRIIPEEQWELRKSLYNRALVHDLDKLFLYQYFEKEDVSKWHRENISHHMENTIERNNLDYYEAIIDYECAALTKPDKPLNAFDTIQKYKPRRETILTSFLMHLGINKSYKVEPTEEELIYLLTFENINEKDIEKEIMQYFILLPKEKQEILTQIVKERTLDNEELNKRYRDFEEYKNYNVIWFNYIANESAISYVTAKNEDDACTAALFDIKRFAGDKYNIDDIDAIHEMDISYYRDKKTLEKLYLEYKKNKK